MRDTADFGQQMMIAPETKAAADDDGAFSLY